MLKPYIICHMVNSIDGRILSGRWATLRAGKSAAGLFEKTAASFGIPAWVVGTKTMSEFSGRDMKLRKPKHPLPTGDFIANPSAESFAIGADGNGRLRFRKADVDGDHTVILTVSSVGEDYLAHLRSAGVSYLLCGKKELDLHIAMHKIRRSLGLKKLMLEGGGAFNGAMLHAGLIDEISQVIVPIIDGGVGITGLLDIPGPPPGKAAAELRQLSHKKLPNGANWFRYKVAK